MHMIGCRIRIQHASFNLKNELRSAEEECKTPSNDQIREVKSRILSRSHPCFINPHQLCSSAPCAVLVSPYKYLLNSFSVIHRSLGNYSVRSTDKR